MPKFEVDVGGSTYEVDAPNEQTAWNWANITHEKASKAAPKDISLGERASDIGAGLVSGTGQLLQFPGQLAGLATGSIKDKDFSTTGLQGVGKSLQDWAQERKSEGLKQREAATSARVQEAEKTGGQWAALKTQLSESLSDPAQLGSFLAEQVPASLPSILAAFIPGIGPEAAAEVKALQLAAKTATSVAAKQAAEEALGLAVSNATKSAISRGASAAVGTAAVQQGTDVGVGAYQSAYQAMIDRGASPEEAASQVLNTARMAGLSGAAISLLANRLPGAQAMERALAGEKGQFGRVVGAGLGALKEIPGEILEEGGGQFAQNVATRQFNPEQSLTEGVGRAGALAALGAGAMGAGVGAIQGRPPAQVMPAPKTKEERLALGMDKPFTPVSLPDGSVAMTQEDLDAYEKAQFEGKLQPAATPPQLGYSPLPGVPKIAADGTVLLNEEQEFQARVAPQKTRITTEAWQAMSPEEQQSTLLEAQLATAPTSIPQASPVKLTKEQQKPIYSPEEIADVKDARAALKDVNAQIAKAKTEGTDLFNRLKGQLHPDDVVDISPKEKGGRLGMLASKAGGKPLSNLVADGSLNEFLPPDMRIEAPGQDESAGVEYIKEALRNGDTRSFDSKIALQNLEKAKEELKSRVEQPSAERAANLELGALAEEQSGFEGLPIDELATYAQQLGVDVESVAQDVANRSQGLSTEQYNGALRDALVSEVNSRSPETQTLAAVGSGEKGFTATKEELQMQKDLLGKDMIQATQYVIKNAPNAFYKFVGNKILQKLKKMQDAGIVLNFGIEATDRRNSKLYESNGITTFFQSKDGRPSSFRILLNGVPVVQKQLGYPSGMNYKTLMHELLHVATQAEIAFLHYQDANNPAVLELYSLYKKVAETFLDQEKAGTQPEFLKQFRAGKNNALESADEMLTWAMTDERMQKWMSDIKVGDKTLFSKIIDLIRSVLGIAKPYETALDRLVRTAEQIIDIETQDTADGMTKRGYYYGPKGGIKRVPKEQQSLFSRAAQAMMEEDTKELRSGKKEPSVPTGSGVESMRILEAMGRGNQEAEPGYAEKIRAAWDNARDNPKTTIEAAKTATASFLDRVETWTFSSDAGLNNRIRSEIQNSTMSNQEKIGTLLNTSLSQTVHSDAVASLFLQRGGIKYNEELHKWEGVEDQSNFVKLSKQLDALAEKNGLTKQQAELVAHTAFEAKRLRSMVRFNKELEQKIATVQAEAKSKRASSPVAASALSKEAARLKDQFKFISDEQMDMIQPGMDLFKVHPELNEVVKTWNEIRENTVKTLVDTGLWSVNEAEEMLSNADYVPFYREEQLENNQGPKEFIRGLQVQAKEKRLKGSSRPVNDIFDNQVRWVQYSINRAVRNRSALALADTAVEVGAAKKVESRKDGDNVVRVWRNGEEQFYSMDDPMFMEAFTGLEAIVIPSWKWASDMANVLRQSVVMYPLFSVAQVPQDSFAAIFSSGLKPQYALRIPVLAVKEFVKTLVGKSRTHEELKNVGAVGVRDFTSAMVRMDAEIYSGLKAPPGVMGKVKNSLNHIAMSADNAVRQAVYEASIAQGLSRAEAMEKAFDVFNVRRKGSSKSLALAGQLIPFFSAYLAAQNVAYKTITGRGISPTDRQEAFKTLAATTASVMVMSLLYAMLNGDDEDYLKKPATVRDRLLMIPGTGGMSIPLRADLFTMPKMITEHMYLTMTDKGYEDGRKFRDSMKAALGSAVLGPTAVPQAIKPLVEVGINYDFFQGRPLVGTYQQKLDTERQFTDSTSELGKILGKTGLVSPIAADHLIRGMFGSAGGLIIYATNPMLHSDPNTPRPSLSERDAIATLPGMSGFMTKSYESALKKDFYTLKEEVDKAANTMNDLKTRSPQEIEGFLGKEENLARVGLQKSVNAIGEQLSNIRKAITQTTNSSMPADQKQQQIEMLRKAEEEMLKGVNVKMLRELGKI